MTRRGKGGSGSSVSQASRWSLRQCSQAAKCRRAMVAGLSSECPPLRLAQGSRTQIDRLALDRAQTVGRCRRVVVGGAQHRDMHAR